MEQRFNDEESAPMLAGGDDEKQASPILSSHTIRSQRSSSWARRNITSIAGHVILVSVYTLITVAILFYRSDERPTGCTPTVRTSYSPAQQAISYKAVTYNASPHLKSPYVGESRPSLDKAWHELLQNSNMRISQETLEANNRTSIPLGRGGGYLGEMAVFHELHCLKFMRQAFHFEDYEARYGEEEKRNLGEHVEHCIELLRQSVMCRADTTLITFGWDLEYGIRLPQPNFSLQHQCADWDKLMDWAKDHAINVFEEGMLTHPVLGPAYPGGHREDRPPPPPAVVESGKVAR